MVMGLRPSQGSRAGRFGEGRVLFMICGGKGGTRYSSNAGRFGRALIRPMFRDATRHDAKRRHARRGEVRWRGDAKGEGDEATA